MAKEIAKIQNLIYEIRGQRVMLDSDLARLYEIETKVLNRAVKRNIDRFPDFFMFQLTEEEWSNLRCQIGTLKNTKKKVVPDWHHLENAKYRPTLPYVFTEHGVLMLSSVLNSKKAISVNIEIMVAFVNMRKYVQSQTSSNEQITELRRLLMLHIENCDTKFVEYDDTIQQIIDVLNSFTEKPPETRQIGFTAPQYKE